MLLIALTFMSVAAIANDKPNIVVIFIDDMGYGDIGPFGSTNKTPQLDRMANEGMKLTDFYVSSSACTPSRSALLTGCYANRIGMGQSVVFPADIRGLNPSEITIAEILKKGGYATGCFGKWHLGDQPEFMPLAQGFDTYEGIPYSNDMWVKGNPKHNFPPLSWIKQNKPVAHIPDEASQAEITDAITDAAVEFIKQHKDEPFFCYVPHSAVHAPHMTRADRLNNADDNVMAALISEIDNSTGRILQTLRDLKLADNTFVLFTNDNGGGGKTSSGPLRGAKFGPKYEGHMRVATLAWWPGKIPAGSVSSEIMTTTDVLPTISRLTGQPVPKDRIIDGKDVSDILLGKDDAKSPHDTLFYENDGIRQGKWKLVHYRIKADRFTELYDLEADLGERNNIADQHPDRVKSMKAALDAHVAEIEKNSRPAGFVENPKPLLSDSSNLPTLVEYKRGIGFKPVNPRSKDQKSIKKPLSVRPDVNVSPVRQNYEAAPDDLLVADFEKGNGEWIATGTAFGVGQRRNRVTGFLGTGSINSYLDGDKGLGTLTSPPLKIERKHLNFLIGGGNHPGKTGLLLLVDGKPVRTSTGYSQKNNKNQEILDWKSWDVSEFIGKEARLQIIDQHAGGWGHILVDHVVQSNRPVVTSARDATSSRPMNSAGFVPPAKPGMTLKDEWSTFPLYDQVGYDQPLRPQFHFSSRMGWLNDPNGMVYYDGEWHMMFQHYAKGNSSGAKSWGNAVSMDLMHWKQLPHAINPYPNVKWKDGNLHAIWSGSAVVDELNALGKQKGDVKTLYAIYTATHSGEDGKSAFFQGAAYSTDKGRTWAKINGGKPVIDHQEGYSGGQRDPRVFYYAPGKYYVVIMMVGGKDRSVRLWKSTDLLNWEIIGDIPNKAAECIDMYHVAVDGDPNDRKWVIADAGTRYEVGEFDGKTWRGFGDKEKDDKRLRFDYGDAWYAAQAFNQGPNGRTVHVGWLRSKQPGYRPFLEANMPFTQQMSIPVEITLRTTPDGIRMFRNPVKEIEQLYSKSTKLDDVSVKDANAKLAELTPELIDLTLTFEPRGNMALTVRGLTIHYDASKQEFQFTNKARVEGEKVGVLSLPKQRQRPYRDNGLRVIPAPTVDGKVTIRVLVDRASLELFVNEGQAAASFVVVPEAGNRSISVDGNDELKIVSLVVNELKSTWGTPLTPVPAKKSGASPSTTTQTNKTGPAASTGILTREIKITGKHMLLPIAPRRTPLGKDNIGNSFRIMVDGVLVHQF